MQDLVLMACGTLDGAMAFCRANGVSVSSVPVPGHEYIVPADIEFDEVVLTDLWQKGIEIGTLRIVENQCVTVRRSGAGVNLRSVEMNIDHRAIGLLESG